MDAMSSQKNTSTQAGRRAGRSVIGLGALLSLVLTSMITITPARADSAVAPSNGYFKITGAGFGHGWGMSQYGAYGAAKKGLSWKQILAFYYPGTDRTTLAAGSSIKVWITADSDNDLRVAPSTGLKISDASGHSYAIPTGSRYRLWRLTRAGSGTRLHYRSSTGEWVRKRTGLSPGTWTFSNNANLIRVQMPSGSYKEVRGRVSFVKRDAGGRTVNRLSMEDYLKSVVPSEMPTSWSANAIRSQAVAARTYAARIRATASASSGYDICDTTSCQVYQGYAYVSSRGQRTINETSGGNAAVKATAGVILKYRSAIALTQFSSSNGGHSAQGDYPYLTARPDPYDGVVSSNTWTASISASSIGRIWRSVGTVRQLHVTRRDGDGRWGGRVVAIKIIGSSGSVTVSGASFRSVFGMRSTLFTVSGAQVAPIADVRAGRAFSTFPRTYDSRNRAELLMINPSGTLMRYAMSTWGTVARGAALGHGFGDFSHVLNAGDWNGDGYQDVIARTRAMRLLLFRGQRTGGLSSGVDMGIRSYHLMLTSVGDFNSDRRPDVLAVNRSGRVYLIFGNGKTGFLRYTRVGSGWDKRDWLRGPGDFNRDGRLDVITKGGDKLYLHKGTRTGFRHSVVLSSRGASSMSAITAIGDITGDKNPDLVGRNSRGQLVLYRGNGKGGLLAGKVLNGSYGGHRFAV
jgi:stage II sporulation protein D